MVEAGHGTGDAPAPARLAPAIRRVTGIALLLLLPVLAFEAFLLSWSDPALYDAVALWWWTPIGRAAAVVLVAALAFHAVDGVRAWVRPDAGRGAVLLGAVAAGAAAVAAAILLRGGMA